MLIKHKEEQCDFIISCGDHIGIGPMPEETIQLMRSIPNLIAVKGNHDRYLVEKLPTHVPNEEHMDEDEIKFHKWERKVISKPSYAWIQSLQNQRGLMIKGWNILITHYPMNSQGAYVELPKPWFPDQAFDIILYGHDH